MLLCTQCHSTYIAAAKFGSIRQVLSEGARKQWLAILQADTASFQPTAAPLCIEHGQLLTPGKLPEVGLPGLVAPCCTTLHLAPADLAQLLQRSIAPPRHSPDDLKNKRKPLTVRIVTGILKIFGGQEKPLDDGLDDILWESRLLPLLRR